MKQISRQFEKSLMILLILPMIYANEFCAVTKDHLLCRNPNTIFPACNKHRSVPITDNLKKEIVQSVNEYRNKVATGNVEGFGEATFPNAANMLEMVWDDNLALTAQSKANECLYAHSCSECRSFENNTFSLGENLALLGTDGSEAEIDWEAANTMFYNEAKLFNVNEVEYLKKSQTDRIGNLSTGHFTQIVWANSYLLGCAATGYTQEKWQYILYVCHYGPVGNIVGNPIYKIGPTCTSCPHGTSCSKNYQGLCSSDNLHKVAAEPVDYVHVSDRGIDELLTENMDRQFNDISSNQNIPTNLSELFIVASRLEKKLDILLSLNTVKRKH